MSRIMHLLLMMLPMSVFSQKIHYEISGKINGAGKGNVLYLNFENQNLDSSRLENGRFRFTGSTGNTGYAFLILKTPGKESLTDALPFFLNEEPIKITSKKKISAAKIKGSAVNAGYVRYMELTAASHKKMARISEMIMASIRPMPGGGFENKDGLAPGYIDSLQQLNKQEEAKIRLIQEQYIRKYTSDPFSLVLLQLNYTGVRPANVQESMELFRQLAPSIRNSREGITFSRFLAARDAVAPGKIIPDFTQATVNGTPISLSDLRGNYVLVDFWASWCLPCRASHGELVKTYESLKDQNFKILSVSLDENKAAWLKAIKQDGLSWDTHVSDLKGWKNDAAALYGVKSVPFNVLIDPNGKILASPVNLSMIPRLIAEDKGSRTNATDSINIIGTIGSQGDLQYVDSVLFVYSLHGSTVLKQVAVNDGNFQIRLPADTRMQMVSLSCHYNNLPPEQNIVQRFQEARSFYIEDNEIKIHIESTKMKQARVVAGLQNRLLDSYWKNVPANADSSGESYNHHFIASHPDSWYSLHLLELSVRAYMTNEWKKDTNDLGLRRYMQLFEALASDLKKKGEHIGLLLETSLQHSVIPFSGEMPDGRIFNVNELKGKVFLIDFWGSWCVWCRKGHPHLKELYNKYKSKGFEIIGIAHEIENADRNKHWQLMNQAIKNDGITWPQILNDPSKTDLVKAYMVEAFPTKILVGRDGKILLRVTSDHERILDKKLEELFGKESAAIQNSSVASPDTVMTDSVLNLQMQEYNNLELDLMARYLNDKASFQKLRDSFIEENKHRPISIFAVIRTSNIPHGDNWGWQRMQDFYDHLGAGLKNTRWANTLLERIGFMRAKAELMHSLRQKGPMPSFTVQQEDGMPVNIKDLVAKNKYTLIDFYSSNCAACVEAIPKITNAVNVWGPKGFGVIGISIDRSTKRWKETLDRFYRSVPWMNYLDVDQRYTNVFNGLGVPGYFLVDQDLKVLSMDFFTPAGYEGPAEEKKQLRENLSGILAQYFDSSDDASPTIKHSDRK